MELWGLSVVGLAALYSKGETHPGEVLEAVLGRIDQIDGDLGAFADVTAERATDEARERTDELARGTYRGLLHGVPVAVKELFDTAGARGDYGSDVLAGRVADSDAELVRRLREAGAVIVGVTRSHEFGWGITSQHPTRPSPRNPWDLRRVPGGSSGGSAAAVAAGMVPLAVASDTGGSVRLPAAFCGVAGLKPNFGRISRAGGVALAPSLDTPGLLAAYTADLWPAFEAMAGPHTGDPATTAAPLPEPVIPGDPATAFLPHPESLEWYDPQEALAGLCIGVVSFPDEALPLGSAARTGLDRTADALSDAGAQVANVKMPQIADGPEALATFVPLQMAEAFDVHNQQLGLYPERAADYGADVRSRLEAASRVSLAAYLESQRRRLELRRALDSVLRSVDVLLSPVTAVGPPTVDDPDVVEFGGRQRPLREVAMGFTVPQNLTGLPTASVPVGFDSDGLPVGVQFTAARRREDTAVRVAGAVEHLLVEAAPRLPVTPAGAAGGEQGRTSW